MSCVQLLFYKGKSKGVHVWHYQKPLRYPEEPMGIPGVNHSPKQFLSYIQSWSQIDNLSKNLGHQETPGTKIPTSSTGNEYWRWVRNYPKWCSLGTYYIFHDFTTH